ncbi:hypothetical protein PAXINDRAFT_82093 [Paxillus involutus ATCC 200175]|uniref:Uncharacterized protein n=1 Tax=Paxillus involutus ATCC 200175 TaxID=664439 RepID=A0A0C9SUR7_PAXIN|nr:hypothetical protein PAXINDRAFT_82093 [Paxillus involutus ATCC 200175]
MPPRAPAPPPQASSNPPSVPLPDSTPDKPKLTGYRLLVVSLTIGFGTAQAILTYQRHTFTPTTLGWIFGIVITLFLAWLGWYENIRSYANLRYWLFERDYISDVCRLLWKGFIKGDYSWRNRAWMLYVSRSNVSSAHSLHFGIHFWIIPAVLYDIPLAGGADMEGNHIRGTSIYIWGTSVYRLVIVAKLSTCSPIYQ